MKTYFISGFADELIKEAGLRSSVRNVVAKGKDYMRRRRLAKELGVKPADVDRVIALRKKQLLRRKVLTGTLAGSALAGGAVAGRQVLSRGDK